MKTICECSDPECPMHPRAAGCSNIASVTLWRVDMYDVTGTEFCEGCASDALDSGLFSDQPSEEIRIKYYPKGKFN